MIYRLVTSTTILALVMLFMCEEVVSGEEVCGGIGGVTCSDPTKTCCLDPMCVASGRTECEGFCADKCEVCGGLVDTKCSNESQQCCVNPLDWTGQDGVGLGLCLDDCCLAPMEWNKCGSGCDRTCENPSPVCQTSCVARCQCPTDRPLLLNGECVSVSDCPDAAATMLASAPVLPADVSGLAGVNLTVGDELLGLVGSVAAAGTQALECKVDTYGKWCGLGHFPKKSDGSMDESVDGIDELDELCKAHDLCYEEQCDHWCPCDAELLRKLPQVSCPNACCESYRAAMISLFSVKPGVHCRKILGQRVAFTGVGGVCGVPAGPCPNGC